jgi:hypothetical protein
MSRVTLIAFLALLAAVAVAVFTSPTPLARIPGTTPPSSESDPFARIATDLKLVVDRPGPFRVQPGFLLRLGGNLVNLSRTPYPVVRPGDGSLSGRGEPHVFMTATLTRRNGEVVELKPGRAVGCGNYDTQWALRVPTLRPGESLPIPRVNGVRLDEEGTVTARVHYRYSAKPSDLLTALPGQPIGHGVTHGRMAGCPPFEVVSDPVSVEVASPYTLKVELKKAEVKVGEKFVLPELMTATVTRTGGDPPGGPAFGPQSLSVFCVSFERRAEFDGGWESEAAPFHDYVTARLPPRQLEVGESVELISLLTAADTARARHWNRTWTARTSGSLTVRVGCYGEQVGALNANPVELTIAPK